MLTASGLHQASTLMFDEGQSEGMAAGKLVQDEKMEKGKVMFSKIFNIEKNLKKTQKMNGIT